MRSCWLHRRRRRNRREVLSKQQEIDRLVKENQALLDHVKSLQLQLEKLKRTAELAHFPISIPEHYEVKAERPHRPSRDPSLTSQEMMQAVSSAPLGASDSRSEERASSSAAAGATAGATVAGTRTPRQRRSIRAAAEDADAAGAVNADPEDDGTARPRRRHR